MCVCVLPCNVLKIIYFWFIAGVTIDEEDESCKITYNMFQLEFTGNTEYKEGLPFNGEVKNKKSS